MEGGVERGKESIESHVHVVGTCLHMCSDSEIKWRTRVGLLHEFEMKEETKSHTKPKADPRKMVKEFVRSGVGVQSLDEKTLRPASVLLETVSYLIKEIVPLTSVPWNVVYDYVLDRLRAVRQDLVIQNITGVAKSVILEQIVLFHLFASYELCESEFRLFDPTLNDNHMKECLHLLLVNYEEEEDEPRRRSRRALFESIHILHNLGSFNALSRLPLFLSLSLHKHLSSLQFHYMRALSCAFHSQNCRFPLQELTNWLCPFDKSDSSLEACVEMCADFGVSVEGTKFAKFDKKQFKGDAQMLRRRKWTSLDERLEELDLTAAICGD